MDILKNSEIPGRATDTAQETPPKCRVCGCKSTGIHYGVLACEGCKAFYKRGLTKSVDYKCYFGGACIVGTFTGGRCKSCRFQKCVGVGMSLQATKMGRIPKPKEPRVGNSNPSGRKKNITSPAILDRHPGRQISPVPSQSSTDMSIKFRNDNADYRTAHTSVIRHISTTPPNRYLFYNESHDSPPYLRNEQAEDENRHQFTGIQYQSNFFATCPFLARRGSRGMARFTADSLWNLRGLNVNASPRDSPPGWMPSDLIPSLAEDLNDDYASNMPRFLGRYWHVLMEKKLYVERSVQTLTAAVTVVYGLDYRQNDELMRDAVVHGLIPHQPQCTLRKMRTYLSNAMVDMVQKLCRFMSSLRGFSELNPGDQKVILKEKWFESYMAVFYPYLRNNDLFYLIGPDGVHTGYYWLSQFFPDDYLNLTLQLMYELKCLRLTQVESFLFLAVAVFNPDTTTATDKTTLSFLHAHYLDCLLQSVRSRQSLISRTHTIDCLLKFMSKFRMMYRISNLYVTSMDWSTIPVTTKILGVPVTIEDILLMEDDGLPGSVVLPLR